jgi:hypothetical protein
MISSGASDCSRVTLRPLDIRYDIGSETGLEEPTGDCSDEGPVPIVKSRRKASTRDVAAKNRFHFFGNIAHRGRHHVSVGVRRERD